MTGTLPCSSLQTSAPQNPPKKPSPLHPNSCLSQLRPARFPKSPSHVSVDKSPIFSSSYRGLWDSWHSRILEGASIPGWGRRRALHPPQTTQNKALFLSPTLTCNYPKSRVLHSELRSKCGFELPGQAWSGNSGKGRMVLLSPAPNPARTCRNREQPRCPHVPFGVHPTSQG